ncbi:methyltransferase domain-containing protein [Sandaracinobacteroides hominis]|uniref:methyltransferase domain-containing protein n=1 Tax=Sandaracinobacteroides hominis TaxID=2780086 RepID=UPI0018F2E337|nr:methyltransferase domain-containing protein [Sandaracinobacteroides hominis]
MQAWPDFSARSDEPEWMDTQAIPLADFAGCLADLEQVNRLLFAAHPTMAFLQRLTAGWPQGTELRVADLGYGQGAMLRRIHLWAERRGLRPRLTGIDLNPQCRELAIANTPSAMRIDWHQGDLFDWSPAEQPHAIISALFTHHLTNGQVVRLLRWQEQTASHGWFINDLHRHWLAWGSFRMLAWTMGWHRFVRHDGALSVRRAFVAEEWRVLLAQAGISDARLRWHPMFRLCVGRLKA